MRNERKEPRRAAHGGVTFSFPDFVGAARPVQVAGTLVDVSRSGFRALHACPQIQAGQIVRFEHITATGTAQVIWNRILGELVDTGFLVLS